MAIYHLSAQIIGRKAGRSAVAAAAYRAGEKIRDERAGKTHDFSCKGGVIHSEILAPDHAPSWVHDRPTLWNEVERIEKRKDAQLAREINIALPIELTQEQNLELIRRFVKEQFVRLGMIADLNIHDSPQNPHAHIMLSLREINPDGFGKKERSWNDVRLLERWRKAWADYANEALEAAGYDARIDHRTLEEQGIEREPTIHLGPKAHHAFKRRQIKTERYKRFEDILKRNEIRISLNDPDALKAQIAEADEAAARFSQTAADLRERASDLEASARDIIEERSRYLSIKAQCASAKNKANGFFSRLLALFGIKTKAVKEYEQTYNRLKRSGSKLHRLAAPHLELKNGNLTLDQIEQAVIALEQKAGDLRRQASEALEESFKAQDKARTLKQRLEDLERAQKEQAEEAQGASAAERKERNQPFSEDALKALDEALEQPMKSPSPWI